MTDHDAFLRAILAAPADDGPRLIYADWLEEAGRPARAAFIRVQCALAAAGPGRGPEPATRQALLREQAALVVRHQLAWDREFAAAADIDRLGGRYLDWAWGRGFVDHFLADALQWLSAGGVVRKLQPIRRVTLTGWINCLGLLNRSAEVAGLDTLRLAEEAGSPRGAAAVADLAGGTLLEIRRLELDMPVTPAVADRVRARLPEVVVALRSEFR